METPQANEPTASSSTPSTTQRNYNAPEVDRSKVAQRPIPKSQTEDPRAFQVGQILRRFKPTVTEEELSTGITFKLAPSDPDFPYDIEALDCVLWVPKSYPSALKPKLKITNNDIPRGFQINIERGFDAITASASDATLLGLMNRLDKQLEGILAGEKAETVKLTVMPNRGQPTQRVQPPVPQQTTTAPPATTEAIAPPGHTEQQKAEATRKRQADTRQLEARLGRLQGFAKSADGFLYTLPLDSPKRASWPASLQGVKGFTLALPKSYPLEPATVHFDSDTQEARNVEDAFKARSVSAADPTIMQQINYLTQHLKEMSAQHSIQPAMMPSKSVDTKKSAEQDPNSVTQEAVQPISTQDHDRPHVQHIPRPPEWDFVAADGEDSESDSDYSYDSGDDTEEADGKTDEEQPVPSAPAERGILLSFPQLELHGIELLELVSLNLTIKCERCKDTLDVERLRNNAKGEGSNMREASCKKCANGLAVGFRADLMHINAARAGYLDLDGCTVVDMLPSNFLPTCAECSSQLPAPGVVSVRGESTMAICRECHRKMSFRIPDVKFLLVSQAALRASRAPGRKKVKESLGITAGTELPRRGRCTHYGKSYRWFRFSCCSKVFACDKCHDEQTDHPNEHANRMLCGFCSREQNYRPEDCGICHSVLTGRRGHGFWEGGQGTRDPARMSRKDPRKYKRRPGTKPKTKHLPNDVRR